MAQKQPPALPFAPTQSSFAPTPPERPGGGQLAAGFELAILTWVSALKLTLKTRKEPVQAVSERFIEK